MPKLTPGRLVYIVYDQRAASGDTDKATQLGFESTLAAAKATAASHGGGAIYSYRANRVDQLTDETLICNVDLHTKEIEQCPF